MRAPTWGGASEEPKQEFKGVHDLSGTDGSGGIGPKELTVNMRALGFEPKKEDIQHIFSGVGGGGNGTIGYEEFLKTMWTVIRLRPADLSKETVATGRAQANSAETKVIAKAVFGVREEQKQEFKEARVRCGTDGSGEIGPKELKVTMRELGFAPNEEDMQEMTPDVDDDGSGAIGFEGFHSKMAHGILNRDLQDGILKAFRICDDVEWASFLSRIRSNVSGQQI